ncbi:MAG: hypothetical protein IM565_09605 [Pseudanabaena sp. M109S1SP2A07QC]|nr:hypothetical protein [Pseudanabaena sp. M109S1SP2A07QC]
MSGKLAISPADLIGSEDGRRYSVAYRSGTPEISLNRGFDNLDERVQWRERSAV